MSIFTAKMPKNAKCAQKRYKTYYAATLRTNN